MSRWKLTQQHLLPLDLKHWLVIAEAPQHHGTVNNPVICSRNVRLSSLVLTCTCRNGVISTVHQQPNLWELFLHTTQLLQFYP